MSEDIMCFLVKHILQDSFSVSSSGNERAPSCIEMDDWTGFPMSTEFVDAAASSGDALASLFLSCGTFYKTFKNSCAINAALVQTRKSLVRILCVACAFAERFGKLPMISLGSPPPFLNAYRKLMPLGLPYSPNIWRRHLVIPLLETIYITQHRPWKHAFITRSFVYTASVAHFDCLEILLKCGIFNSFFLRPFIKQDEQVRVLTEAARRNLFVPATSDCAHTKLLKKLPQKKIRAAFASAGVPQRVLLWASPTSDKLEILSMFLNDVYELTQLSAQIPIGEKQYISATSGVLRIPSWLNIDKRKSVFLNKDGKPSQHAKNMGGTILKIMNRGDVSLSACIHTLYDLCLMEDREFARYACSYIINMFGEQGWRFACKVSSRRHLLEDASLLPTVLEVDCVDWINCTIKAAKTVKKTLNQCMMHIIKQVCTGNSVKDVMAEIVGPSSTFAIGLEHFFKELTVCVSETESLGQLSAVPYHQISELLRDACTGKDMIQAMDLPFDCHEFPSANADNLDTSVLVDTPGPFLDKIVKNAIQSGTTQSLLYLMPPHATTRTMRAAFDYDVENLHRIRFRKSCTGQHMSRYLLFPWWLYPASEPLTPDTNARFFKTLCLTSSENTDDLPELYCAASRAASRLLREPHISPRYTVETLTLLCVFKARNAEEWVKRIADRFGVPGLVAIPPHVILQENCFRVFREYWLSSTPYLLHKLPNQCIFDALLTSETKSFIDELNEARIARRAQHPHNLNLHMSLGPAVRQACA